MKKAVIIALASADTVVVALKVREGGTKECRTTG